MVKSEGFAPAVARVDCFAIRAAFPVLRAGRHPHLFLSRPAQASLHVAAPGSLNRPRRPLSRGFNPASRPAKPLVSYQVNRQFPGWNIPPLVKRALGAHLKVSDFLAKNATSPQARRGADSVGGPKYPLDMTGVYALLSQCGHVVIRRDRPDLASNRRRRGSPIRPQPQDATATI